jgi:hypothetical protein
MYVALPVIPGHTLLALSSIHGCHTGIEGIRIRATHDNDIGIRMAEADGFSGGWTLRETLKRLQRLFDEPTTSGVQRTARHQSGKQHGYEQGPERMMCEYAFPTTIVMFHSVHSRTYSRGILCLPTLVGRLGLFHKPDQW